MLSNLVFVVPLGILTTAFWPRRFAAQATPLPWLPSVAVRKWLAEFFSQFIRGEYMIRQFADIPSQFFGYVASHGVGTAQNLKCVETEAVGFVLAVDVFYSQKRRQGGKLLQRSYRVLGKLL